MLPPHKDSQGAKQPHSHLQLPLLHTTAAAGKKPTPQRPPVALWTRPEKSVPSVQFFSLEDKPTTNPCQSREIYRSEESALGKASLVKDTEQALCVKELTACRS